MKHCCRLEEEIFFHWRQDSLLPLLELCFMLIIWWCTQLCQRTGQSIQIHFQKGSSDCTFQQCDRVKFSSTDFAEIFLNITVLKLDDELWGLLSLNNLWCFPSFLSSPISSSYYMNMRQWALINWKSTWSQSQHVHTVSGQLRMPFRTAGFKWWPVPALSSNAHLWQFRKWPCSRLPLSWRLSLLHLVAGKSRCLLSCPGLVLCFNV